MMIEVLDYGRGIFGLGYAAVYFYIAWRLLVS